VKALRLACWNADGFRGRKLELEHFLRQHEVDICLLTETHLRERDVFRLANEFDTEHTGPQRVAGQQYGSVGV
jgi:exonuclease III